MNKIYAMLASVSLLLSLSTGQLTPSSQFTVSAADSVSTEASAGTVTFDETSGTLTLSGNVVLTDVTAYAKNTAVKKVVAAQGTVLPESCRQMFQNFTEVESIDLSKADTSGVTNMSQMFESCKKLTDLNIDGFDTSNVTSMSAMFYGCESLTSLDVTGFDTSNVILFSSMFGRCYALETLDLSSFDTSNATSLANMFINAESLTSVDLSHFDTSKVTEISYMFSKCKSLTELDLSNFHISGAESLSNLFSGCSKLRTVDISNFDTSKTTNFREMFAECPELTTIIASSDKWSLESIKTTDSDDMFKNSTKLVGGNGTLVIEQTFTDYVYANIDTFENPGYLTDVKDSLTPPRMDDVVLDEETGVLTLSGKVNASHVALYRNNEAVKKVVASEGTILPPSSRKLFYRSWLRR